MTSISGTTTDFGDSWIRLRRGWSQPWAHSQCASRKISTSPCATRAPANRALIKPDLKIHAINIYWSSDSSLTGWFNEKLCRWNHAKSVLPNLSFERLVKFIEPSRMNTKIFDKLLFLKPHKFNIIRKSSLDVVLQFAFEIIEWREIINKNDFF